MKRRLKWACIGVGKFAPTRGGASAIAYAHAEAMKRNADCFELVAGASLERENLDNFAREYPCRGYLDMDELLAKEPLDGCTISTWAPAREEHVAAAIRAGVKNILIEKPLSLTMAAARRMKAAADKVGTRLFVNFQRRYGEPFGQARAVVQSGRLGKVFTVELVQPCANALDFGPHFVNMALFLLGETAEPLEILAAADGLGEVPWHGMNVERRLSATLTMKDMSRGRQADAAEGRVKVFFTADPDGNWTAPAIRVIGEKGYVELWAEKAAGMASVLRIVTSEGIENPPMDENFHHGDADKNLYFERAYRDLGAAIAEGKPCRLDFVHGYLTQSILLGAYASAQTGRTFVFGGDEPDPAFT